MSARLDPTGKTASESRTKQLIINVNNCVGRAITTAKKKPSLTNKILAKIDFQNLRDLNFSGTIQGSTNHECINTVANSLFKYE